MQHYGGLTLVHENYTKSAQAKASFVDIFSLVDHSGLVDPSSRVESC